MKKHFYVSLISVLMAFSLLFISNTPIYTCAADIMTISAGKASGVPGDTVVVPVTLSNNTGIIATRIHIKYDTSLLELTDVKNGEIFDERHATFNDDLTVSRYTMLWYDAVASDNYMSDGKLAELTFKIKENAPVGTAEIKIECDLDSTFNYDIDNVDVKTQNGSVEIISASVPIESLSLPEAIELKYKTDKKLNVTISPENADEQVLVWKSSNTKVLEVDDDGNLKTNKRGTSVITVSTEDGEISDTCTVTVKYSFGQWLIIIFLFGWIWY